MPSRLLVWTQVILAAVAMVMTIPGRTQGLGLITEQVLQVPELGLDRIKYSGLNVAATLLGAVFALPFGWLTDRAGVRGVLAINLLLLGVCTWAMAGAAGIASFFAGMFLMRGLGQSALSTTSLTLVGKWFPDRLPRAMAVFTVVSTIGFGALFVGLGAMVEELGWRTSWSWLGMGLVGLAALAAIVGRNPAIAREGAGDRRSDGTDDGVSLVSALRGRTFWVLALSCGLFNWVSSGIGLFNEDVLKQLQLEKHYHNALAFSTLFTLITSGVAGWAARWWSLPRLLASGMLLLAACLAFLPFMTQTWHVFLNAAVLGSSAGLVMVVFFACWGVYFGRRHLGKIQGTAQAITVLASALGPLSLALARDRWGTYQPLFLLLGALAVLSAALLVVTPRPIRLT